jgi:hypothetical protein
LHGGSCKKIVKCRMGNEDAFYVKLGQIWVKKEFIINYFRYN